MEMEELKIENIIEIVSGIYVTFRRPFFFIFDWSYFENVGFGQVYGKKWLKQNILGKMLVSELSSDKIDKEMWMRPIWIFGIWMEKQWTWKYGGAFEWMDIIINSFWEGNEQ